MFGRKGRREAEVSEILDRARAHPPGTTQRIATLEGLIDFDVETVAGQALARCERGRPEDVLVGADALGLLPLEIMNRKARRRTAEVTRALCGPGRRDIGILTAALPVHVRALDHDQANESVELLGTLLQHTDGVVRAAAARTTSWAAYPGPLIPQLISILDEDPLPEVAANAAAALGQAVCRDPSTAPQIITLLATSLDDPRQALHAWHRAKAVLLGAPDPVEAPDLPDALRDDLSEKLVAARRQNWSDRDLQPVAIRGFIDAVNGAVRRHEPAPGWDEAARRTAVRDLLQRAGRYPAGTSERDEILVRLLPDPSAPAWTDRRAADVAVEEALALCRAPGADGTALGAETLAIMVTLGDPGRPRRIHDALAELRGRRPADPIVLAAIVRTYSALAARGLLDESAHRAGPFVLELFDHEDHRVRAAAVLFGDPSGRDGRIVDGLIRLLDHDHDPEPGVRANAALGLAGRDPGDPLAGPLVGEAFARHARDPDPAVRAQALSWGVRAGRPGALRDLVAELSASDAGHEFVFLAAELLDHVDGVSGEFARDCAAALARLEETGWAGRAAPAGDPDPETRAAMLTMAIQTVRLLRPLH